MFLPKPTYTGNEFRQQVERTIADMGFVKTPPRGDEQYVSVAQGCFITIERSGFGNSPAGGGHEASPSHHRQESLIMSRASPPSG